MNAGLNRHEVIIIVGGQAGLALGHHLAHQRRRFTILDGLPGRPFPGHPGHYPTRDEVVDYLTDYAREFELEHRRRQLGRHARDRHRPRAHALLARARWTPRARRMEARRSRDRAANAIAVQMSTWLPALKAQLTVWHSAAAPKLNEALSVTLMRRRDVSLVIANV
jgi:hypothetical protein